MCLTCAVSRPVLHACFMYVLSLFASSLDVAVSSDDKLLELAEEDVLSDNKE